METAVIREWFLVHETRSPESGSCTLRPRVDSAQSAGCRWQRGCRFARRAHLPL